MVGDLVEDLVEDLAAVLVLLHLRFSSECSSGRALMCHLEGPYLFIFRESERKWEGRAGAP